MDTTPTKATPKKIKRVQLIINPVSGYGGTSIDEIHNHLKELDLDWSMAVTAKGGDAKRFAAEAVREDVDAVVVFGGDGTVFEVGEALMNTGMPMLISPCGTGNAMAHDLGVPRNVGDGLGLLNSGKYHIREVDVGVANDQHFMLRMGVGLEAEMSAGTTREDKANFGRLAYLQTVLQNLGKIDPVTYTLTLDGEEHQVQGVTCIVSNVANIGVPGLQLLREIDASDGLLDVVVIEKADLGTLISLVATVMESTFSEESMIEDTVQHWQAKEIVIDPDRPQQGDYDGEPVDIVFPLNISLKPHALRVIVPEQDKNNDQ